LLSTGYQVTQSHACVQAIKTNAPPQVVWDVMRQWCKQNPLKGTQSTTSPSHIILSQEPGIAVDFNASAYNPVSTKFQLVRYQQNPTANWGPQVENGNVGASRERQKRDIN
jgi:tRNA (guanine26-N2/guanine27-N2)-dimethyltransferase